MESEKEQYDLSEKIKLEFIQMILHDLSHIVANLQAETEYLKRREKLSEKSSERVERISQYAQDIASGLKMISFYGADERLISCDFFDEVLRPVISFCQHYCHPFYLRVERTIRDIPKVLLRPGPVRRMLVLIISSTRPEKIRCSAKEIKGNVIFRFDLQRAQYSDEYHSERIGLLLDGSNLKLTTANWRKDGELLTLEFEVSK